MRILFFIVVLVLLGIPPANAGLSPECKKLKVEEDPFTGLPTMKVETGTGIKGSPSPEGWSVEVVNGLLFVSIRTYHSGLFSVKLKAGWTLSILLDDKNVVELTLPEDYVPEFTSPGVTNFRQRMTASLDELGKVAESPPTMYRLDYGKGPVDLKFFQAAKFQQAVTCAISIRKFIMEEFPDKVSTPGDSHVEPVLPAFEEE